MCLLSVVRAAAICVPACQNLGFCIAPNECKCASDFEGPACENPVKTKCMDQPPVPMNSRVFCNEEECTAKCNSGYQFPTGTKKMEFDCKNGAWVPRSSAFTGSGIPNCQRKKTAHNGAPAPCRTR